MSNQSVGLAPRALAMVIDGALVKMIPPAGFLPDRPIEGKVQSPEVAERVLVRRPRIGDTRPAPVDGPEPPTKSGKPKRRKS